MTQLGLFEPPVQAGVLYAVVDVLSGEVIETRVQRGEADRLCADMNKRFGRIPARAPDAPARWRIVPDELAGALRYVVEAFNEDGR